MSDGVLIMVILLLVFMFFKVPVFISLFAASAVYFILTPGINPAVFAQQAITGTESITLLAIPFFVAAGALMNYAGITSRVVALASVITGRLHGGLAQVAVMLSTLMGGLSGSSLADAAMTAKMLVNEMEHKGIPRQFGAVVTSASAIIDAMIPPGIGLILYGVVANVSIGKLFVGGFGPGILLCALMLFTVNLISRKRGYAPLRTTPMTGKMFTRALGPAILPLMLPLVIIGGIRIGVFTASEAGAVAVVYAIILGVFYRELKLRDTIEGMRETIITTSSIMLIIAGAATLSWVLTKEMVPQTFTAWMIDTIDNKWVFILAMNVFLLIAGMFVEGNALMIVLAPLFAPVAAVFGFNEIHFAMVFIFANTLGSFSPPLGTLMFVVCGVTGVKTKDFIKEAVPFYILLVVVLIILTFVPFFTSGIVDLIF